MKVATVVLCVVVGLSLTSSGCGGYSSRSEPAPFFVTGEESGEAAPGILCSGHDEIVLATETVVLQGGTAIRAMEHCRLEIDRLVAQGSTGIHASEHAIVEIKVATIEAVDVGIYASDHSTVQIGEAELGAEIAAIAATEHAEVVLGPGSIVEGGIDVYDHASIDVD